MNPLQEVRAALELCHRHEVQQNRAVFLEEPPTDHGIYVYTYYFRDGSAIYHGFTADAPERAKTHWKAAPWASWVDYVRYRKCRTVRSGRRLESRLQKQVPSLCHVGKTRTYHGDRSPWWREMDRDGKTNHVLGHCKLPGGVCDAAHMLACISVPQSDDSAAYPEIKPALGAMYHPTESHKAEWNGVSRALQNLPYQYPDEEAEDLERIRLQARRDELSEESDRARLRALRIASRSWPRTDAS
jgi:hypothetical protein